MEVWVEKPLIEGDTVTFRWTQSAPNPYQTENSFYYRYEGIDLTCFSVELFYEIFLSLQLRVFSAYKERVTVHFPSGVPAYTSEYWSAYHNAVNVSITPLSASGGYCPWVDAPVLVTRPRKAAVFFGGGKDSTLATCLFSEIYGAENVVLIQFVGPLRNDSRLTRYLEERQERLMLKPARDVFEVATQRAWTNYQANFRRSGYHRRPHLELYTVGGLPALLAWGVDLATFTAMWSIMSSDQNGKGGYRHEYRRSRPDALQALTNHYAATLNESLEIGNIILPFHGLAVHWLLAERYPAALETLVSCTLGETDARWCYQCKKCALFGMSSLCTATPVSDFDYDYFLTHSAYITSMIAYAESGAEPDESGNLPWIPSSFIGERCQILGCHMIARIDPRDFTGLLGEEAQANLALLQAMFGNRLYPDQESLSRLLLDLLGPTVGPRITEIVGQHLDIVDGIPGPNLMKGEPINYLFEASLSSDLLELEHIRGLRFDAVSPEREIRSSPISEVHEGRGHMHSRNA